MSEFLGDFLADQTVYCDLDSYNGAGASAPITGLAVTDIEIYKNSSMTQRSSDAGYTLLDTDGIDLDGIVGINGFTIDTSDDTDTGFFAAGNDYRVVLSSVTLSGETVNVSWRFSIQNRYHGVAEVADAVWDEGTGGHNIGGTFGKKFAQIHSALTAAEGSITDAGPTATDFDTDLVEAGAYWNDAVLIFESTAANAGLARTITLYDGGAVGNVEFDEPWPVTPVNGDPFLIISRHVHTVTQVAHAIWDDLQASHDTAGTFGEIATEIAAMQVQLLDIFRRLGLDVANPLVNTPANITAGPLNLDVTGDGSTTTTTTRNDP